VCLLSCTVNVSSAFSKREIFWSAHASSEQHAYPGNGIKAALSIQDALRQANKDYPSLAMHIMGFCCRGSHVCCLDGTFPHPTSPIPLDKFNPKHIYLDTQVRNLDHQEEEEEEEANF